MLTLEAISNEHQENDAGNIPDENQDNDAEHIEMPGEKPRKSRQTVIVLFGRLTLNETVCSQ